MQKEVQHLYLVGIGGVGMVWIADYALAQGWQVSGSELATTAVTERLTAAGAHIHIGPDAAAIPNDLTEAIVTSAITPGAPSYGEYEALVARNIPIRKRAEWIGALTKQKFTIAVAGAHGKTTTTAMIGWVLDQAGLDPTVFVGGAVKEWGNATRIGKSNLLVLEADEYDRSFHQFHPHITVVVNIDADHLDYYTGGLPEIEQSYKRFLRNLTPRKGILVGYGKDTSLRKIARGFKFKFRWYDEAHLWPGVQLAQPGMHLLLNATAAARVAHELGVKQKVIRNALGCFPGVGRRMEYLGKWNEAELFDDYGHHPKEIAATLKAARAWFGVRRITLVFQPHQKARTQSFLTEFGRCFDASPPDLLILAPIYQVAGREQDIAVTSTDIATEIAKKAPSRMEVMTPETEEALGQAVVEATKHSGILIVMGAGNIRTLVEAWR